MFTCKTKLQYWKQKFVDKCEHLFLLNFTAIDIKSTYTC